MIEAAETAEQYTQSIRGAEALMRGDAYAEALMARSVEQALHGIAAGVDGLPPAPQDPRLLREIIYMVHDAAVRRLWQLHRIVYDIDPGFWAELSDIDLDTKVPGGLMACLPHPNPFVALPEPIVLPLDDTHRMRVGGFYVTGSVRLGDGVPYSVLASTHAENASGDLALLVGATVEDHQGRPYLIGGHTQDMVWTRVTLPTGGPDATIGEYVAQIAARFDSMPATGEADKGLPAMITAAMAALIYLCATNAELRPLPAAVAQRQAARSGRGKPLRVIQVGHQLGAALRAWHRSEGRGDGTGGGTTPRPHVRRAHMHTFRCGPGRTEFKVKFLSPIPVGFGDKDAEQTTTYTVS